MRDSTDELGGHRGDVCKPIDELVDARETRLLRRFRSISRQRVIDLLCHSAPVPADQIPFYLPPKSTLDPTRVLKPGMPRLGGLVEQRPPPSGPLNSSNPKRKRSSTTGKGGKKTKRDRSSAKPRSRSRKGSASSSGSTTVPTKESPRMGVPVLAAPVQSPATSTPATLASAIPVSRQFPSGHMPPLGAPLPPAHTGKPLSSKLNQTALQALLDGTANPTGPTPAYFPPPPSSYSRTATPQLTPNVTPIIQAQPKPNVRARSRSKSAASERKAATAAEQEAKRKLDARCII